MLNCVVFFGFVVWLPALREARLGRRVSDCVVVSKVLGRVGGDSYMAPDTDPSMDPIWNPTWSHTWILVRIAVWFLYGPLYGSYVGPLGGLLGASWQPLGNFLGLWTSC
jgi:hypothetical protein